ncbi:MAG: hypothetical protein VYD54_10930 [Bdellovibrionota bacterium]|nr:hypothetical protein [Bdellovibrionota bacterium]
MRKNFSILLLFFFSLSSAHAIITTVPGKPGKFQEHPDRYKGKGTGFSPGSFMDCQTKCSRHDGLCREYNRDREIRAEKLKLKYPKKPGKPTLLELAGGKPAVKVPPEDCDKHLRNCRVPCGKQP